MLRTELRRTISRPSERSWSPASRDSLRDLLKVFRLKWTVLRAFSAWMKRFDTQMKDSGVMSGGKLKPENNALYAKYLLRFIEEYERRGVHLSALTVQNEPLQNDKDYPSMKVEPPQEGEIIEALHKVYPSSLTSAEEGPDQQRARLRTATYTTCSCTAAQWSGRL